MAQPRRSRTAAVALVAPVALALLAAGACGGPASPSPDTGGERSAPPAASPPATGEGRAPRSTPWAGNAVLGIERLGAADNEIRKGINDFNAGVQNGDPELLLRAASGLASVDVLLPEVDNVAIYEPMRPFADDYRTAITEMSESARALEAALEAGDGDGVTAASRRLIDSFELYSAVQAQLAEYVHQIPEQKRLLVR